MKRVVLHIMTIIVLFTTMNSVVAQSFGGSSLAGNKEWKQILPNEAPPTSLMRIHPVQYFTYQLDEVSLKAKIWNASENYSDAVVISLPMPDGTFRDFRVWQTPMMPNELAAKYPEIRTFTAEATNDHRVTAKLDFTAFGFHSIVFESGNTSFIDPYDVNHDGYYVVHYKKDETRIFSNRMKCEVASPDDNLHIGASREDFNSLPALDNAHNHHSAARTGNGWNFHRYRLALSADHFYCQAATGLGSPTILQALSAMTTSMNRINGVYNREFSVQMNFCAKEDTLIWPIATGSTNGNDPFNAIDANANACLTANQTQCDTRIGNANYDLGHVFTTGGGGLSLLLVVCATGNKAQSVTGSPTPVGDGYDIDYVAHEMGHEFGSNHTFNNGLDGSCSGNYVASCAYEPGSGATIMDYAGICSPDDLQMHSDAYFSGSSLLQITAGLVGSEHTCANDTTTSNHLVSLPAFTATYNIPYKTPFELIGPTATDSVADTSTMYDWFQWNLGDAGKRLNQTYKYGPIFRSYFPVYTPTRIFPKLSMVLSGVLSNAGTEGAEGEKAADTARFLTFRMVVRDILAGKGCFLFPDDSIHINASSTGSANGFAGFKVTSQNTTGIVYTGGSSQTITWNVVGTTAAPVSCANVDIFMSVDGGNTWAYTVATGVANSGTWTGAIPNPGTATTTARFKVKGSGNVFFNINGQNFTVNPGGGSTAPITGTFTVCVGAHTTLADATTGGTWVSHNTAIATVTSAGIVTGVSAGVDTISYTAGTSTVTALITVNPLPSTGAISGGAVTICIGQIITLSEVSTGGSWSSSASGIASVTTAGIVTGVSAGTANIDYSITNTCGTATASTPVTVNSATALATAPVITPTTAACVGTSVTYTATLAGATAYVWSLTGTGWTTTGSTIATLVATVGTSTGQLIVHGSNFCGSSPNDTVNISVITPPATPTVSLSGTLPCFGATNANYIGSSAGATSYSWQSISSGWTTTGSTSNTINVAVGTGTGVLICEGVNACGNSAPDTFYMSSSPLPSAPSMSIIGAIPCPGATFTQYVGTGSGATGFKWIVLGTGWSGATTLTTDTLNVTIGSGPTGTIIVQDTNACGGGPFDTVYLTPSSGVGAASPIAATTGICIGSSATFITSAITGATGYAWTISGTGWSGTSTSTSITLTVGTGPATITVYGYNACGAGASYTLSSVVPVAIPTSSFTIANHVTGIGMSDLVTYTGTASSGGTYSWNFGGGIATPGVGIGPHHVTWSSTGLKTLTLSVTDTGCTSTVFTDTVLVVTTTEYNEIAAQNSNIVIYPNPNAGLFDILFGAPAINTVTVKLSDIQGRVVYTAGFDGGNNKLTIATANLPNGVYMATIVTEGETYNKKVIINR